MLLSYLFLLLTDDILHNTLISYVNVAGVIVTLDLFWVTFYFLLLVSSNRYDRFFLTGLKSQLSLPLLVLPESL